MFGCWGRKEGPYRIKERALPTTSRRHVWAHDYIYAFNLSPFAFYSSSSLWKASLSARMKSLLFLFSWCTIGHTWTQSQNWGVRLWEVKEYREQNSRAFWQKRSWRMSPGKLEKQVFTGVSVCLLDMLASSLNKSISRDHEFIHNPQQSSNDEMALWPPPELVDMLTGEEQALYLFEAKCCDDLQFKGLHNISTPSSYHIVKEKNQALCIFICFNETSELMGEFQPICNNHYVFYVSL